MEEYVARAMLIPMLSREQLEKVQAREQIRHYILGNWNILEVFNLGLIKEKFNIPFDDLEAQARHAARIKREINDKFLVPKRSNFDDYVDWIHAMDWNIYNRIGEVVWDYVGQNRKFGKGKLSELLDHKPDNA